jgi:hypothetical protein
MYRLSAKRPAPPDGRPDGRRNGSGRFVWLRHARRGGITERRIAFQLGRRRSRNRLRPVPAMQVLETLEITQVCGECGDPHPLRRCSVSTTTPANLPRVKGVSAPRSPRTSCVLNNLDCGDLPPRSPPCPRMRSGCGVRSTSSGLDRRPARFVEFGGARRLVRGRVPNHRSPVPLGPVFPECQNAAFHHRNWQRARRTPLSSVAQAACGRLRRRAFMGSFRPTKPVPTLLARHAGRSPPRWPDP